jgi:glutamate dehydrogenase
MALTAETSGGSKLSAIVRSLFRETGDGLSVRFAKELFNEVDPAEFETYGTTDLVAVAAGAFESFRKRRPGEPKIVLRQRFAGKTELLTADIVNDDMPFLLDSVLGGLRDLGLVPELVAHPIFEVRRSFDGTLTALDAAAPVPNGIPRESFIHLQIRKTGPQPPAEEVEAALGSVLRDVRLAVSDFTAMAARLNSAIEQFESNPPPATAETNAESVAFLRWLLANNFVFLGIREYGYAGDQEHGQLLPRPELGLGLLRDLNVSVLRQGSERDTLTPQGRAFFLNSPPIIVAKANSKSTVYRRIHMDTVGVKLYGADGNITGGLLFAGLFTATAYNLPARNVPLLRQKVGKVLRSSGYPRESHSERALLNVLETFPRDELFQISPDQLARISEEVLKIDLTPRPRVFVRRDEFRRFASVFVYIPRERHSTQVRVAIETMLEKAFGGHLESATPFYPESATVRVHFVLWRQDADLHNPAEAALESKVEAIITTWTDEFRDCILKRYGSAGYDIVHKYLHAFPAGYRETNSPERALQDILRFEKLGPDRRTDIDLYRDNSKDLSSVRATLQQLDEPITLSKRVPILENFGFDVIAERTFLLTPKMDGAPRLVYLHDSDLHIVGGGSGDLAARRADLEDGFLAVWGDAAPNDRFNGLILAAGLDWRQAAVLRAYSSYYRQTGAPHSVAYVAEVLNKYASIAADLFALFDVMFNPAAGLSDGEREAKRAEAAQCIVAALDKIPLLDDDRILRNLLKLIGATSRTNFYHRGDRSGGPSPIAFKLRSREIDWLPDPKPFAEIFVHSPRFEGVHLRAGPIARGGLRWSDRPQDFRTEILGLAKAQQVKNAVIVPRGAKGGFVPAKQALGSREAAQAEGIACYKSFVSSLLSITDNLVKGEVKPPADTIRRDGDDPYLVVAADKGTATFSDIANDIARTCGFWLGDAFASGGSAGYDHKKMGITAKGAWEAVKRHFREQNADIQTQPFTVAGVGDMSGDVFGNGMLLSKTIKLVAAFDHRDIFIDPDPDPALSWEERKRLFELPRSSWQDYDRSKLSQGGGIYSRAEKHIALPAEARNLLGVKPVATPDEILSGILKAPVDLLWFGGIGTYVRSSGETDLQVRDKANDAIRVAAKDVRAKVVGEGANLGVTQRGRIEFALPGGKINTDAIDNSAGVNTSDVEVNIKIALDAAVSHGRLDTASRNEVLGAMTADVASAVLRNNYQQTLAISLAEKDGLSDLGFQQRLMQKLEQEGRLDRALETLPSDAALLGRQEAGTPLTRPELAVLLAYAKISLEEDLIHSSVPDDPYLGRALFGYFPPVMRERFAHGIETHPLRREIIATSLANDIINTGGPTFIVRMIEETGHMAEDIAYAFAAVMAVYQIPAICGGIDGLDSKIDGQSQLCLYRRVQDLLRRQTAWFLRHNRFEEGLEPEIARYRDGVEYLIMNMAAVLPEHAKARLQEEEARLLGEGLPAELAMRIAALEPLSQALDIVRVANETQAPIAAAAQIVFAIRDEFHLDDLGTASEALAAGDYFNRLAINSSLAAIASAERDLARSVLALSPGKADFAAWKLKNEGSAARVAESIAGMLTGRTLTLAKLTVGVAQLRDLAAG